MRSSFDVAILGAGISGSVVAAILAKQGFGVVILDQDDHPRFALGESTIPHTTLQLILLAERYGVPELEYIAHPDQAAKHVCTTCGLKRAFGFAYHRPGQSHDPREGIQLGTNLKDELQLFRQDIDAYLFNIAVRYGAEHRLKTKISGVKIDGSGVHISTGAGEELTARYVIDGTGYRSVLADLFDLRERPTRFKHHSRCLFTHMIDVGPFEADNNPLSQPWELTTLHHVIERGWWWVIPFNNHPASTNPLVSVGLTLDPRRYPRRAELSAEQEFRDFVGRYPAIAKQFTRAKSVRPWVSTDRLQYSSKKTAGYRWCLMSHAAGAVDALYSRGLINTFETVSALMEPLLAALRTDDFDEAAFAHIEPLQQRVLSFNDRLVNCSFIAWDDFDLWNAWLRVWALGTFLAEYRLMKSIYDYTATRDARALEGGIADPIFSSFEDPDYAEFFPRAAGEVEAYERGELAAGEAARRIFALIEKYPMLIPIHAEAMRRAGWLKGEQNISERSLEFLRQGYRWAMGHPDCRDLLGNIVTFYRWRERQPDPHVVR